MFSMKTEPAEPQACVTNLENYHCERQDCDFVSNLRVALWNHKCTRHLKIILIYEYQEVLKWYECDKCGHQSFSKLISLHHFHSCQPSETKPLLTRTSSSCPYIRPQRTLTSTRKFKCGHCPYSANQKSNLKKHVEARHLPYDEINWFKCDECSFMTKRKTHLHAHKLYKHNPNPETLPLYQCDLCEYKSRFKVCVTRHSLLHASMEEVRWFCCEFCSYKSKFRSALKRHVMSNKHPELKDVPFIKHSVLS